MPKSRPFDQVYSEAKQLVTTHGKEKISAIFVKRQLHVGGEYAKKICAKLLGDGLVDKLRSAGFARVSAAPSQPTNHHQETTGQPLPPDEMFGVVRDFVINNGRVSVDLINNTFQTGVGRARRLIHQLREEKVINIVGRRCIVLVGLPHGSNGSAPPKPSNGKLTLTVKKPTVVSVRHPVANGQPEDSGMRLCRLLVDLVGKDVVGERLQQAADDLAALRQLVQ